MLGKIVIGLILAFCLYVYINIPTQPIQQAPIPNPLQPVQVHVPVCSSSQLSQLDKALQDALQDIKKLQNVQLTPDQINTQNALMKANVDQQAAQLAVKQAQDKLNAQNAVLVKLNSQLNIAIPQTPKQIALRVKLDAITKAIEASKLQINSQLKTIEATETAQKIQVEKIKSQLLAVKSGLI